MAWIRPVALALALALAPGAACDEGGATPAGGAKVAAGPAGEVVHVEGEVTATRPGEAPRALEVGSPVNADDTIAVPMSAEVSIVLAHNKVQWDIGSGQSYRVDQSRAWTAKSGSGSALDERGDLGTASAGRHGEREAGETQATAQAEAAPPEESTRELAVARDEAAAPPKPASAVRQRPPAEDPAPPQPREKLRGQALGMSPADAEAVAGGGGGGGKAAPESRSASAATAPAAPRRALAVALGEIKVRGARPAADVASVFASFSAAACGVSQTGAVVLRFEIGGDGAVLKPRLTGPAPLVAEVKDCVTASARKLRFTAGASGNTWVEREIRFSAKTK